MVKSRKRYFKKSLSIKRKKRIHFQKQKIKKSKKEKNKEVNTKEDFLTEEGSKSFQDFESINDSQENDLNESQDINFSNIQDTNTNDPSDSDSKNQNFQNEIKIKNIF